MCEACDRTNPEVVKAYEEFEEAIKRFLVATGTTGDIMTDWVLITAETALGTTVDSTRVGYSCGHNQANFRTLGMIHSVLDDLRAFNVTRFME